MNNILISVIIPSYNYEKYIGTTLQSLIAQTLQEWECIVVDDGSTDNTKKIVTDFAVLDKRIKYIYQNNAGQSSARNNGLRIAKGEYIQFLDADDLLEPLKLEYQVEFLQKHPEIDIVYGETRYFRTEFPDELRYSMSDPDEPWMLKISGFGKDLLEKLVSRNIMTISSPLIKKRVINRVGDFDSTLEPLEDWDFWVRCAIANCKIQFRNANGSRDLVRIHPLSSSQNKHRVFNKHKLARKKLNRILPSYELRTLNKLVWLDSAVYKGAKEFEGGKKWDGVLSIWQAIIFSPPTTAKCILDVIKRKLLFWTNLKKN